MAKAVICPVCNGIGTAGDTFGVDCHGCRGKGWVEVADDPAPYIPYYYPAYVDPPPIYPTTTPWYTTPWYTTCWHKEYCDD